MNKQEERDKERKGRKKEIKNKEEGMKERNK